MQNYHKNNKKIKTWFLFNLMLILIMSSFITDTYAKSSQTLIIENEPRDFYEELNNLDLDGIIRIDMKSDISSNTSVQYEVFNSYFDLISFQSISQDNVTNTDINTERANIINPGESLTIVNKINECLGDIIPVLLIDFYPETQDELAIIEVNFEILDHGKTNCGPPQVGLSLNLNNIIFGLIFVGIIMKETKRKIRFY
jgi:hypothetical protein